MNFNDSDRPPISAKERILLDPKIRKVHDYWMSKQGGAGLPARRDIDPIDLSDCLGAIALVDVVADGRDFVIRLAGLQVEEAFGRPLKGHKLPELFKEASDDKCFRGFRLVAITGKPDFRSANLAAIGRPFVQYDRAALPLSEDGSAITQLLCCYTFVQGGSKPGG